MKNILFLLSITISIFCYSQNLQVGLEAHYPLDSNGNDLSTTGNNLIIDSSANFSSFFGNDLALEFNGMNRAEQTIPFNNSNFTSTAVSLWFRADSAPAITITTNNQFFLQAAYAGFGMGIDNSTGKLFAYFSYSSSNGILSDSSYFDSNWHHFVAQNNGISTKIYIDGVLNKSKNETHSTGNSPSLKKIYLGGSNINTRNLFGGLNDVRVYNRILTQAEITLLSTFPTSTIITKNNHVDATINIYPNPTKGNIIISADEALIGSNFIVRNLIGQNITEGFLQSERQDVTINGEKGIYFIEIFTPNNKKIVSKVIKD